MHFAAVDYLIIFSYLTLTFLLGILFTKKHTHTTDDYVLAGRRVTLPAFVATLVATWYGGILGVGEFSYRYGLVNWVTQGLFYYIFAGVFALFLAKRIRKMAVLTIPDRLEQLYGKPAALVGALFTYLMILPAPYVLIVGILLQVMFNWSLFVSLIVGAGVSTLYVLVGGFRAVVRTDILQFVLMFLGFLVLIPVAFVKLGGLSYLQSNLPEGHLTLTGELGAGDIFVWGFFALWTLVDPGFYQRCLAAKDAATAQKGLFISIGFWILFDALTCTAGLYARAALPGIDPLMAYPLLAEELLPPLLKGLFFTGMLATVMSTLDSFTFLSALTIANDFIARLRRQSTSGVSIKNLTRLALLITAAGAVGTAWISKSVIGIWYTVGTIAIPPLLLPVLSGFTQTWVLRPKPALWSMVLSAGISVSWLLWGYAHSSNGHPLYPLELEPIYPGLAVSFVIFLYSRISRARK